MQSSTDVLNQLRDFQAKRRKPQDILSEEETKLGLPSATQRLTGLRGAISNTENLLRGVDPSVTGRTQGSLVTEAQRQRMVAQEREPISEQFREQSRALEGETANTTDIANRALKSTQLGVEDLNTQENAMRTLYSSLYQREQDEYQKQQAEIARKERERQFLEQQRQFNEQLRSSQAAVNAQNAYMKYLGSSGSRAAAPAPKVDTAKIQQNEDAAYLGRLRSLPQDQQVAIIAGLRQGAQRGDGRSSRLFSLGKQLGYWKF